MWLPSFHLYHISNQSVFLLYHLIHCAAYNIIVLFTKCLILVHNHLFNLLVSLAKCFSYLCLLFTYALQLFLSRNSNFGGRYLT